MYVSDLGHLSDDGTTCTCLQSIFVSYDDAILCTVVFTTNHSGENSGVDVEMPQQSGRLMTLSFI